MTGIIEGLMAGMGAAGWVIGFVAVLGGFLLVFITIWALCMYVVELYADKKEEKENAVFDD